jgi:3',5'-cyclic AMP phosphodiesterase CpdA
LSFRIAQLSDIHFGGENRAAVEATVEYVHAAGVGLVVLCGDLTVQGRVSEYAAARAWADALPDPMLITPGNHDAPYGVERLFAPFKRFEEHFGRAEGACWDGEGFMALAINTARGMQPRANWSKGQISEAQIGYVSERLGRRDIGDLTVLACHHPLTEMIGGPMTARVWNGTRAARTFTEAHVDLVLTGHIHAPFAMPYGFGDGKTYAVGSGTLSVRERGTPPSFNIIESTEETHAVSAIAWTGSKFEVWRTWALPRRTPDTKRPG